MATSWVSHVSGPIPSHHIYNDDIYYEKKPQEKVTKLKTNSTQLSLCGKGYFGSVSNRTVSPKDHMMENVKRMREIHRASRQRQEDNKVNRGPVKSASRPDSTSNVYEGKVDYHNSDVSDDYNKKYNEANQSFSNNNQRRAQSASPAIVTKLQIKDFNESVSSNVPNNSYKNFLRAHEKTGPLLEVNAYPLIPMRKGNSEVKISVPRASTAREVQLIRRDIDFVRANAYAAKSARLKRSPSADSLLINQNIENDKRRFKKPGEIPSYLIKRRNEWKEEEQHYISNQPDPDQPPGHRKMPEKERIATLELLKATEKDMLTELGRLPIRSDTLKLRTKKQEIESKLNELEEAIKIFSKPKVFVRIDE